MSELQLPIPDHLVEHLVDGVTERVLAQLGECPPSSPWLTAGGAAQYLA